MSDSAAPAVLDLLRDLVAIDSTSGSIGEAEVLRRVAAEFEGVEEARVAFAPGPGSPQALLVVPVGLDPATPLLVFAAHADVVPVTDASAWSTDPFSLTPVGDRLHGRGSSDMKSGLAAAVVAVRSALGQGAAVALVVTTGEEVGCLGAPAAAALLSGLAVGAVVIPESTDNEIVLGHRGALWLTVATAGLAAHGSTPERGRNAVLDMARLLVRLEHAGPPLAGHPELGAETVNVGVISGGGVPNIVPDRCEIRVDHRVARDDVAPLIDWWRSQPEVVAVSVDLDLAAVWTRRDHPWLARQGAPVSERPASYFTDGSILVRHIDPDVPVVVWGPGDPTGVHGVDESVSHRAVLDAVELFEAAALGHPASPAAARR